MTAALEYMIRYRVTGFPEAFEAGPFLGLIEAMTQKQDIEAYEGVHEVVMTPRFAARAKTEA